MARQVSPEKEGQAQASQYQRGAVNAVDGRRCFVNQVCFHSHCSFGCVVIRRHTFSGRLPDGWLCWD